MNTSLKIDFGNELKRAHWIHFIRRLFVGGDAHGSSNMNALLFLTHFLGKNFIEESSHGLIKIGH